MHLSNEKVHSLHGKYVDVIDGNGTERWPGMFRVTDRGPSTPLVEVIFRRKDRTLCQRIPPGMLPAIITLEQDGIYTVWNGLLSEIETSS